MRTKYREQIVRTTQDPSRFARNPLLYERFHRQESFVQSASVVVRRKTRTKPRCSNDRSCKNRSHSTSPQPYERFGKDGRRARNLASSPVFQEKKSPANRSIKTDGGKGKRKAARRRLSSFWCRRRDLNPHTRDMGTSTSS